MKKQSATDAYVAAVAAIAETLEALKAYAQRTDCLNTLFDALHFLVLYCNAVWVVLSISQMHHLFEWIFVTIDNCNPPVWEVKARTFTSSTE